MPAQRKFENFDLLQRYGRAPWPVHAGSHSGETKWTPLGDTVESARDERVRIMDAAEAHECATRKPEGQGDLKLSGLAVLRYLLFRRLDIKSGACFPTLETIARESGLCVRTVQRAIWRLRRAGFLNWINRVLNYLDECGGFLRRQISNAYFFTRPKAPPPPPVRTKFDDVEVGRPEHVHTERELMAAARGCNDPAQRAQRIAATMQKFATGAQAELADTLARANWTRRSKATGAPGSLGDIMGDLFPRRR